MDTSDYVLLGLGLAFFILGFVLRGKRRYREADAADAMGDGCIDAIDFDCDD